VVTLGPTAQATLVISQAELVKPKVEPADDLLFQLGINLQKYLSKTPRWKEYVEGSPLKNTTITPTHLPDMATLGSDNKSQNNSDHKTMQWVLFILKSGTILVTREGYKGRITNSQHGLCRYMKSQPANCRESWLNTCEESILNCKLRHLVITPIYNNMQ
jgi:hypothetical protein